MSLECRRVMDGQSLNSKNNSTIYKFPAKYFKTRYSSIENDSKTVNCKKTGMDKMKCFQKMFGMPVQLSKIWNIGGN